MKINNILAKLFSLVVILMLLFTAARPDQASAQVPEIINGKAQAPASFNVSKSLRDTAITTASPEPVIPPDGLQVDPIFGPFLEKDTSRPIPHPISGAVGSNPPAIVPLPPVPYRKEIDPPMPNLDKGWDGLNQGVNRVMFGYGVYPPDTNGAASAFNYIQTVNNTFAVWDLTQLNGAGLPTLVYGPGKISSLWAGTNDACGLQDDGDPIVLYDESAHRWLISQFSLVNYPTGPFFQCIAVSATQDPLGRWNLYRFAFDVLNDYPKFGIWQDGYYMTINQFQYDGIAKTWNWGGQGVVAFERSKMLMGDPAARMIYINNYTGCTAGSTLPMCVLGGMLPSDADGKLPPAGTPNYFIQFDDDAWGYSPDQLQIWAFNTNWTAGTGTFTPVVTLPVNAFDSYVCVLNGDYDRNCVPQPDTTVKLDAISDRLMYRFQFRDFSSAGRTDFRFVVNHTVDVLNDPTGTSGQAGVRWYELRSDGAGWSVYQQGDQAPDTSSRWMGSLAMDKDGNMALGYSLSSSAIYPVPKYAGRLAGDPLNTLPQTEAALTISNLGSQTGTAHRWGDYSMMDVGPGGCEYFYTNEYLRATSLVEWYTRIGMFHFPTCDGTPSTRIIATPNNPSNRKSAAFTFTGVDDVGVTGYQCSIDNGAFTACTSPVSYTNFSPGLHKFAVRAIDTISQVEPNPATFSWIVKPLNVKVYSSGLFDGWILESSPTSSLGGTLSAVGDLIVGDDAAKKQYRSVISFDTGTALPDGSKVLSAQLGLKRDIVSGSVSALGPLLTDIQTPAFGTAALVASDFQAIPSLYQSTAAFTAGIWYTALLKAAALPFVNTLAPTQFRVRFNVGDNGNLIADNIKFFSGDSILANRPFLVINYLLP